ncbi:MAG TPA: flagellar hook basal-body protein, partial [Bacteroidales bacterium]|nr:flagellar hook basal-body protein [Bacteroidales bacterium]
MFNGLRIGTTGMKTAQRVMDNVADQIANSDTNGYKKKEVNFSELLRNEIGENQVMLSENAENAAIGAGSRAVISKTNFTQGIIMPSEGTFHMAIEGNGYFGVSDPEGNLMLTRNGAFQKNGDQSITDESGNLLSMVTYLPQNQWGDSNQISITSEGLISGRGPAGESQVLGRVMLYQADSSDSLISLGEGKYIAG